MEIKIKELKAENQRINEYWEKERKKESIQRDRHKLRKSS